MNPSELYFSIPDEYLPRGEHFKKHYVLEKVVLSEDIIERKLIKRKDRKCRFCGLSNGETTFRNKAHLFPKSIGNASYLSDFECDACNEFFSEKLENDLAYFLGLGRSLSRSTGESGVPTFTSPDGKLSAFRDQFFSQAVLNITRKDVNDGSIKYDAITKVVTVKTYKHSYRPLAVYKALLKMALSVIDEQDIFNYGSALQFLFSEPDGTRGWKVYAYQVDPTINFSPMAFVMRKIDPAAAIHTHVVALYFQNYIFSLPVLWNGKDRLPVGIPFEIPIYPPLFPFNCENLTVSYGEIDLSSNEKVVNEEESFDLKMIDDEDDESVALDMKTNILKRTPFNPSEIMQLTIGRPGQTLFYKGNYTEEI